ncbi:hypothetical protein FACS189485_10220 [Spirochaetia bacterium]|nr:hypothetical protein FACS189485_10220 [Spirochaetia bacterium]
MKKTVVLLVMLTLGFVELFAQTDTGFPYYNGYTYIIAYSNNMSSTDFSKAAEEIAKDRSNLIRLSKLPDSIHQVITHALEDYTLNVGDCFVIHLSERGSYNVRYAIILRITNRNGTYEYFAFYGII